MPELGRLTSANASLPLWSCLTVKKRHGTFLGHDVPEIAVFPDGLNSGHVDGSANWVDGRKMIAYYRGAGEDYYWEDTAITP
ncbi:MAG: hypothetical protein D6820_08330 [Lentisphaerae bacterium]|nr:MAG: hypothetical protein D6820_08330 [Lentisphaerota bacterium]